MRVLLLGSLTLALLAQSPEAVQRRAVEERFLSTDPVDLAWGAYLAANYGFRDYIPRIQQILSLKDGSAKRIALDALIRLNATDTSADVLEPLLPEYFDPTVILLLQNPDQAEPVLLRFLNRELSEHQWYVVHSALLDRRTKAQAAALVRNWTFRFRIMVVDAGTPPRSTVNRSPVCVMMGRFLFRYPAVDDFIIGQYRSVALRSGPHPLTYDKSDCFAFEVIDRRILAVDYLRYMAAHDSPLPGDQVLFENGEGFIRSIASLRSELEEYAVSLRDSLLKAGALDAQDWRQPKIEIVAEDRRSERPSPLTGVDWLI